MARPKKVLSVKNLPPVILAKHGNLAAVGRAFGVSRNSVYQFVQHHPELEQVITEAKETGKDVGEESLMKAVKRGEGWAVCFFLKCQGKDRGYIETVKHQHGGDPENDTPITVQALTEDERERRADELLRRIEARRLNGIGAGTMGDIGGHPNGSAAGNGAAGSGS